ncbi:MAG: hypothetical protein H6718_04135 [Polyangiaceae bacterium]|nr:hypothetical protein [Polyangiaceae bacterium]
MQALFDDEAAGIVVRFGRRQVTRQSKDPGGDTRVIIEPGQSAKLGKIVGARKNTSSARVLRSWEEAFTVWIWARDPDDPKNELAQYKALTALHNQVTRAMHLSHIALLTFGEPELVLKDIEFSSGMELKQPMNVLSPIEDIADETATAYAELETVILGGTYEAPSETVDGVDTITVV